MYWAWAQSILEFVVGCGVLIWSAGRFINASAVFARKFGMPPLVIGMLLVGFGTSLPELIVSLFAAAKDNPGIAIGNAIGSNVVNIGMVAGITAIITPLAIHSRLLKREFPILIGVTVLIGLLFWDGTLSRVDGIILLVLLAVHLYWMFFVLPKDRTARDTMTKEYSKEMPKGLRMPQAIVWWFIGLTLLLLSSELVVSAAVTIARRLAVSDLVIGLTIVAIGTSLPELAASIVSALRKEHDIAIGNIVGSNIFNLLAVLAMPALLSPTTLPKALLHRDYPIMLLFTVLLWLFCLGPPHRGRLGRVAGLVLVGGFIVYLFEVIHSIN